MLKINYTNVNLEYIEKLKKLLLELIEKDLNIFDKESKEILVLFVNEIVILSLMEFGDGLNEEIVKNFLISLKYLD